MAGGDPTVSCRPSPVRGNPLSGDQHDDPQAVLLASFPGVTALTVVQLYRAPSDRS